MVRLEATAKQKAEKTGSLYERGCSSWPVKATRRSRKA